MVIVPMEKYLMPMGTLGALKYQDKLTRQAVSRSVVITLPEQMNCDNATALRESLADFFANHDPAIILFDVTSLKMMDSRGLGVLLYAIRKAKSYQIQVAFCGHPNGYIAELLCLTKSQGLNEYPACSSLLCGTLWNAQSA